MADGPGGEKTERATPKRREEARKEGQVARSMEINSAFALIAAFVTLLIWGPRAGTLLGEYVAKVMSHSGNPDVTQDSIWLIMGEGATVAFKVVAPFLITMTIVGVLANILQVNLKITPEVVKPRIKRINPINGFKQKFSPKQLVELFKNLFKMVVVGGPAFAVLWYKREELLGLTGRDPWFMLSFAAQIIMLVLLIISGIYILVAGLDYLWQKYRYESQIKMTKYEVKQEMRQQDMAPEMKAQQRRRQREAARQRMMADVPEADVIVTNPTHFSIALKYAPDDGAPKVVAKGADLLALRIREIARDNGVMIVENKPLARALYWQVEAGQFIPGDLFAAVAEVLAYVYRRQTAKAREWQNDRTSLFGGTGDDPADDVPNRSIEHA